MATKQQLLTTCDAKLGGMDGQLGKATERQGVLMAKLTNPALLAIAREAQAAISAAHALLAEASIALANVATSQLSPATSEPKTGLRPGQIVGDVGGTSGGDFNVYTGPNAPSSLSKEDWQVFSQYYERMGDWSHIFSSSPVGQEKDPDTGVSLEQGDLAQTVDIVAYKAKHAADPTKAVLAPYLP